MLSGIVFIFIGLVLIDIGLILKRGGLPGDILIRREGLFLYIPITSAVVLSLILSGIAWLIAIISRKA